MKTLIIAGGIYKEDFVKEYICPDDYNYIIAVDKGLSYTESLNLFPDLIVGDFDSVRNSILSGYDKARPLQNSCGNREPIRHRHDP